MSNVVSFPDRPGLPRPTLTEQQEKETIEAVLGEMDLTAEQVEQVGNYCIGSVLDSAAAYGIFPDLYDYLEGFFANRVSIKLSGGQSPGSVLAPEMVAHEGELLAGLRIYIPTEHIVSDYNYLLGEVGFFEPSEQRDIARMSTEHLYSMAAAEAIAHVALIRRGYLMPSIGIRNWVRQAAELIHKEGEIEIMPEVAMLYRKWVLPRRIARGVSDLRLYEDLVELLGNEDGAKGVMQKMVKMRRKVVEEKVSDDDPVTLEELADIAPASEGELAKFFAEV